MRRWLLQGSITRLVCRMPSEHGQRRLPGRPGHVHCLPGRRCGRRDRHWVHLLSWHGHELQRRRLPPQRLLPSLPGGLRLPRRNRRADRVRRRPDNTIGGRDFRVQLQCGVLCKLPEHHAAGLYVRLLRFGILLDQPVWQHLEHAVHSLPGKLVALVRRRPQPVLV